MHCIMPKTYTASNVAPTSAFLRLGLTFFLTDENYVVRLGGIKLRNVCKTFRLIPSKVESGGGGHTEDITTSYAYFLLADWGSKADK